MKLAMMCLRLNSKQKEEIPEIFAKGVKLAIKTILERILVGCIHGEEFEDLPAMLRSMDSPTSMRFLCSTLL